MPGLNPKSLQSASQEKEYLALIVICRSNGAVNPGDLLGLFHRAISQSAIAFTTWVLAPRGQSRRLAGQVAALFNCPTESSSELVACLREQDAYELYSSSELTGDWIHHTPEKGNCGRNRKTSPADDRLIVRKSKLNPRLTAVDLTRELMATTGANIHVTTVRRRLWKLDEGLNRTPAAKIISGWQRCVPTRPGTMPYVSKNYRILQQEEYSGTPWPGNSPDINPIENLWSICKRRMRKMDCSAKEKMISALIGVWFRDEEMKNICGKLVESMPNHLRARSNQSSVIFESVVEPESKEAIITEEPFKILVSGTEELVPWMVGVTSNEGCLFTSFFSGAEWSKFRNDLVWMINEIADDPQDSAQRNIITKTFEEFYYKNVSTPSESALATVKVSEVPICCLKVRIYKTVILPVVLYGCETWTLTLTEEHRLRVFENKVLRKIFGAKRDEVTGEWRKLHNTELHALYSSPDIIRNIKSRRLRWAGHVARMGESRNAYRVLVGRPEGKRSLGRPRRRWEDNIKMDLREVGYDVRDWINLARDRDRWRAYVRAAMNLRVP
ncbi:hypothetical protein ANN_13563 [Periplaneta americana]|uniref:Carboxylesterase type B domain-containing protein n=1 Tax=Periplaneta americana TaxID=6978 RepID=A0ABQ8TJR9_PERAM|nr:hypothetical protein ANN_13563 [Periplaneta americana]